MSRLKCAALCLSGLGLLLSLLLQINWDPVNDFTGFWIGAKLLGTPFLYDIPSNLALQKSLTGYALNGIIYVRPPFFAAVVRLFTWMSYPTAILVWRIVITGAWVAFAAVFPLGRRRYTVLAVCWSVLFPVSIMFANDAPLVLLLIALSLVCWGRKRPLLTGVMLGLCLVKFHFLVFLPILLIRREHRRVLAGFAGVAAVFIAINFLVQPDWLPLYWKALNMPQPNMNGRPGLMPNFYASFYWTGHPGLGVAAGALMAGAAVWAICQRFCFEVALPFCILGGILVSPHTNHLDAILAIPALLVAAQRFPQVTVAVCVLLSPFVARLYSSGPACLGPAIFVGGCLMVMARILVSRATPPAVSSAFSGVPG
jgi:glycosyl transferase family 87